MKILNKEITRKSAREEYKIEVDGKTFDFVYWYEYDNMLGDDNDYHPRTDKDYEIWDSLDGETQDEIIDKIVFN